MSGHSKWANIKNKKEKADNARGKIFTKIGREIAIAVKEGGSDPNNNSKLRDVIAKAKANNMPNDNITRSIKKAAGEMGSVNYEEITYEGYGPGGTAIIVEVVTDNRNRTASEIRHIFDKSGGSMGATGCVSWMFDKKGLIVVERSASIDEDELMMEALDAGADDFEPDGETFVVYTKPDDVTTVAEAIIAKGYKLLSAQVEMLPQNGYIKLTNEDDIKNITKMLDMFEDNDDVQNVWHNWEE